MLALLILTALLAGGVYLYRLQRKNDQKPAPVPIVWRQNSIAEQEKTLFVSSAEAVTRMPKVRGEAIVAAPPQEEMVSEEKARAEAILDKVVEQIKADVKAEPKVIKRKPGRPRKLPMPAPMPMGKKSKSKKSDKSDKSN